MQGKGAFFGEEEAATRRVFASLFGRHSFADTIEFQFCSEDRSFRGRAMYLPFPLQSLQRHS